jgi:hypothetical protein
MINIFRLFLDGQLMKFSGDILRECDVILDEHGIVEGPGDSAGLPRLSLRVICAEIYAKLGCEFSIQFYKCCGCCSYGIIMMCFDGDHSVTFTIDGEIVVNGDRSDGLSSLDGVPEKLQIKPDVLYEIYAMFDC